MNTNKQKEYQKEYYLKNKERKKLNPSQTPENKNSYYHKKREEDPDFNRKHYLKYKEGKDKEFLRKKWRKEREIQTLNKKNLIKQVKENNSCYKCNENRPYVLDFHHINPKEKDFNIGNMTQNSYKAIKTEISKCITLCRNCHSEFHYLEKKDNINLYDYIGKEIIEIFL